MTSVTDPLGHTTTYDYDAAGRRTSLTLPNGVSTEYQYDAASRLTALIDRNATGVLGDLTYEYDAAGNRIEVGGSFARTGLPQPVATATYDAANQQTALGSQTMTYDLNGNVLSLADAAGPTSYTWNARNQLTALSGPGVTASFVYDGLGRRLRRTFNGTTTDFLYDGLNPVQELSGATVLANILTGLGIDEYFARTDVAAGITSHFLSDALGSTVALTDPTGTVQTSYTYEPFGATTATGALSSNPFQFTGRENDATGLYYYRARYYQPGLQRFVSEDPLNLASARVLKQQQLELLGICQRLQKHAGQLNLYSYVESNPAGFRDPYGLFAVDFGGGGNVGPIELNCSFFGGV